MVSIELTNEFGSVWKKRCEKGEATEIIPEIELTKFATLKYGPDVNGDIISYLCMKKVLIGEFPPCAEAQLALDLDHIVIKRRFWTIAQKMKQLYWHVVCSYEPVKSTYYTFTFELSFRLFHFETD